MYSLCISQAGYVSVWQTESLGRAIHRLDNFKDQYLDTASIWIEKDGTFVYGYEREDAA